MELAFGLAVRLAVSLPMGARVGLLIFWGSLLDSLLDFRWGLAVLLVVSRGRNNSISICWENFQHFLFLKDNFSILNIINLKIAIFDIAL